MTIEPLHQRHTVIAAVTGQIDVRGFVATEVAS